MQIIRRPGWQRRGLQPQRCKACGRVDKFDFDVPDAVWAAVVPDHLRNRVVCLPCFDDFAKARSVEYASTLRALYFAGRQATFIFESVCSVTTLDASD